MDEIEVIAAARSARARRMRRAVLAMAAVAAVVGVGLWGLRGLALRGLPDVGHPFDVKKDGHLDITDDRNAYIDYLGAIRLMTRSTPGPISDAMQAVFKNGWGKATPELVAWLDTNRAALDLWRKGTEKTDALLVQPATYNIMTGLGPAQALRDFARLAALEGRRLEAQGKMAEAWGWYRALLRSSRHVGRRGSLVERLIGIAIHGVAAERVDAWAADPRVDAGMLRSALDDALAADGLTPPTSDMLKSEYFNLMNTLDDSTSMRMLAAALNTQGRSTWEIANYWLRVRYTDGVAFSRQEPERSRRVIRLIWANWLAYCDLPASKRPPTTTELSLYQATPDAPAAAHALPPEELLRWYETTLWAKPLMPAIRSVDQALRRERSRHAAMVLRLADQLYRREHDGHAPPSPAALVGPYLKALPDDP